MSAVKAEQIFSGEDGNTSDLSLAEIKQTFCHLKKSVYLCNFSPALSTVFKKNEMLPH